MSIILVTVCVCAVIRNILSRVINPLNPELNPICYLLALLAYHFLHVSRIRVKSVTRRLLMSYIYIYIYIYLYDISSLRVKQQDVSVLSGVCCPELHYL